MLDESLPTFVVKPASDKPKQQSTFLYSQYGSDFEPAYTIRHLDPEQHASKNRYAVGLYDAFVPDVLFAEVLLIPEWTQPTLSAEQIRANGGVPPPPEPLLPMEFQIQLYNPDQQVAVRYRPATFTKDPAWEFEMPQQTFREPSASKLDMSQHDPSVSEFTPKIQMRWKKDSKFNKDLACYQSGKSMNPDGSRKKNREPDITLAIFKALKEVTLYAPNWNRVEIEDMKGFEVVLLLGAVAIRDIYFSPMKDTFHLSTNAPTSRTTTAHAGGISPGAGPPLPTRTSRIPPTDPRTQWEIDAETAWLTQQATAEDQERRRRDAAEQRQIRKMLEKEERDRRRQQAELDKETAQLIKRFGKEDQSARPTLPVRPPPPGVPSAAPPGQAPSPPFHSAPPGPYMSGAAAPSSVLRPPPAEPPRLKPKSSFFGFRRPSDDDRRKLHQKRSSMW